MPSHCRRHGRSFGPNGWGQSVRIDRCQRRCTPRGSSVQPLGHLEELVTGWSRTHCARSPSGGAGCAPSAVLVRRIQRRRAELYGDASIDDTVNRRSSLLLPSLLLRPPRLLRLADFLRASALILRRLRGTTARATLRLFDRSMNPRSRSSGKAVKMTAAS
jgi:hypothetical protein